MSPVLQMIVGLIGMVLLLGATTSAIDNAVSNVGHAYELTGDPQ